VFIGSLAGEEFIFTGPRLVNTSAEISPLNSIDSTVTSCKIVSDTVYATGYPFVASVDGTPLCCTIVGLQASGQCQRAKCGAAYDTYAGFGDVCAANDTMNTNCNMCLPTDFCYTAGASPSSAVTYMSAAFTGIQPYDTATAHKVNIYSDGSVFFFFFFDKPCSKTFCKFAQTMLPKSKLQTNTPKIFFQKKFFFSFKFN
jgi:hypothetical protein